MTLGMILMSALVLFIHAKFTRGQAELARLRAVVALKNDPDKAAPIPKVDAAALLKNLANLKKDLLAKQVELDRLKGGEVELERLKQQLLAKQAELDRVAIEQKRKDQDAVEKLQLAKGREVELEHLKQQLLARQAELERMATEQKRAYQEALEKLQLAHSEIAALNKKLDLAGRDQKKINREMIGLRGDLIRTAIIIDSSGSMKGQRWDDAVNVMAIWLDKLPVQEAVLIVYSSKSIAEPDDDQSFIRLDGPDGEANRKKLIDRLRGTTPGGGTFTRGALERAFNRKGKEIDSIILFTDGAPNTGLEAHFVPAEAEKIYALIGEHKNIPINAIGVGQYFDKDLSGFLLKVGRLSGGTFMGR